MPNGTHTVESAELVAVVGSFTRDGLAADGWTAGHGPSAFRVGDVVVAHGRNALRRGIVTKVGRTNLTFEFTTPSAIDEATRYGWSRPNPTAKVVKVAEVFAQIEAEQIEATVVEPAVEVAEIAAPEIAEADAEVVEVEVGVEVETPAELPAPIAANREAWLEAATVELRPVFASLAGIELPERVRVSCGWPGSRSRNAIGTCWYTAADKVAQVFVSPVLDDPIEILGVLVHELIHAWDRGQSKHAGAFRRAALAVGLTGKMTATTVGDELRPVLADLAEQLGTYPHARITVAEPAGTKKQTTRMIKIECPTDGYTARTTRKWLDDLGTPSCPCGQQMTEAA